MQKIYDTHLHIWDKEKLTMPWLNHVPSLNKSYRLEDYEHAARHYQITHLNYVEVNASKQCLQEEADYILNEAESSDKISSIVLGADLTDPHFSDYITSFAHHKKVRGIRHGSVDFDTDTPYLEDTFIHNVRLLAQLDLHCEILPKIQHMQTVNQLISLCPDTCFIIDHCGFIPLFEKQLTIKQQWQKGMQDYAKHANTLCKISGLLENAGTPNWTASDMAPIVNLCCDLFGEDRILFGSNWPVCTIYGSLSRWIEALYQILENRSATFKNKFFYENAEKLLLGK